MGLADAFQQLLAQRTADQHYRDTLAQREVENNFKQDTLAAQAQQHRDQMAFQQQTADRAQRGQDLATGENLREAIPAGRLDATNPAVPYLRTVGAGKDVPAQPAMGPDFQGPAQEASTEQMQQGAPAGFLKTASFKQQEAEDASTEKAAVLARQVANDSETNRHNTVMEGNAATQARAAMIRANKPQGGGGGIQLIQTPDGWVKVDKGAGTATPVTNAGTGDQVLPATSAVTRNRVDSAKALVAGGARMTQQLADPNFAAQIGPALGRYNTLRDFIGNPPPEYAKLAGEIESFALANMGVHGMRSTKGAEDIKSLLDQHHTPQSLAAAIDGILGFSRDLISGTGGKQPAPQQQQPAANNDPLGIRK